MLARVISALETKVAISLDHFVSTEVAALNVVLWRWYQTLPEEAEEEATGRSCCLERDYVKQNRKAVRCICEKLCCTSTGRLYLETLMDDGLLRSALALLNECPVSLLALHQVQPDTVPADLATDASCTENQVGKLYLKLCRPLDIAGLRMLANGV